ncbi:ImmA/IrrE family metallo-endopeptidase [Enterococcus casseliflavus]|uniref:ImmA/IrrE family metallo-endopeptidase n=1 Tax=Enterococcus casseliflavus TaxID=37734 RepID=UPI00224ED893|nr:ImmA/IrrE family metallo-endopeptidase [Enterococcus casseliflavus]MCX4167839.1 ImmA/IrrE family metallo-endopeptidase [Enterococcus casseliflavus]
MQLSEELMIMFPELTYKTEHGMPIGQKGLLINETIYLNPNQEKYELNSTLAEELGHYLTSYGNIVLQDTNEKRKQERRARDIGSILVVSPQDIIECFEEGCRSTLECALHLQITEDTFKDAVKYYSRRFSGIKTENNYTLLFQADGTVAVLKSFNSF